MAFPFLVYNFNENNTTTINDYSNSGYHGTGTGLTIVSSGRVGNDAELKDSTDSINAGIVNNLNGQTSMALHLTIMFGDFSTDYNVISKDNQFQVSNIIVLGGLVFAVGVASGTALVFIPSGYLSTGVYYDIQMIYESNVLYVYVDGVEYGSDNTQSGALVTNSNEIFIGDNGVYGAYKTNLNEVKLYAGTLSSDNRTALIDNPKGILSENNFIHNFSLGDIIVNDLEVNPVYAIVTYVVDTYDFRFQPITAGICEGMNFQRVGNTYDVNRQYLIIVKNSDIAYYDLVTKTSDVGTESKKLYQLNGSGIVKTSSTKTTTYQVLRTDQRIYVDSTGGAFTVTLESSPTTNRVLEIIDSTGSCGTFTVTINGNGKNIIGNATALMNASYISFVMVYNGTQWNLI